MLINDEEFHDDEFDDKSIEKLSRIVAYQVPNIPVWVE